LLDYHERRSPFDLALLGFRGDIKTSTYFLEAARTTELFCDFYITRFFKLSGVQRTWVTFLQERFWAVIADTTLPITPIATTDLAIDQSAVYQIKSGRKTWLILDYDIWKRLVANVQREGK
jgi:hypothetical protein